MSLANKYRPKDFRHVIGNDDVVASIKSMTERDEVDHHHAMLFSGPAGTGKTTLARIVASKYDIHQDDIEEINVADDTGVDMVRNMIRMAKNFGMRGRRRAFILDEAHMMTTAAQNAALKFFEEPPAHVYIFIASTDPQKLLPTIRSRIPTFTLEPLDDDDMKKVIANVIKGEGVTIPEDAYDMIIASSGGSPRMALTILDKVIDLDDASMLRAIEKAAATENAVIDLCQALLKRRKWPEVSKIIKGITDDPERVRRAVLGYFTSVALGKENANAILMIDCFKEPYYNTGKAGLVLSAYMALQD